jgi:S1-C subfamily serine protease/regulator of sirC expression with transglutaminase-like and TPR domain
MTPLPLALAFSLLVGVPTPPAAKSAPPKTAEARTAVELAKQARPAVVVITFAGRDGKKQGLGTGFVVAADGLIATNLHVVGEARPVTVQTSDGKQHPVTTVYASDRTLDLALLRIDAKGLPTLPLGDSDALKAGEAVVALGHPLALKYSVVSGVVSGRPTIESRQMIQLAIPIEPGNSGGPLLDMRGHVVGIITLKSQLTANLGFAMPANALRALLRRPNPVPMSRWVTIGRLHADEWATVFEGNWRQSRGLIVVDGPGSGFGGRTLCLAKRPVPKEPYEVAVTVRLDSEGGAGGLAFRSDGRDRHYGFYPSGGKLRLSRFEGPDVFSWKVLAERPNPHYRPGDWNTLKVRVEKDRLLCYVNDHLVIESDDDALTEGKVGLVKFRTTHVEFKHFQLGAKIGPAHAPAELAARVAKLVRDIPTEGAPTPELVGKLAPDAPASLEVLQERAKRLERQAARLRELAQAVHEKRVLDELARVVQGDDDRIDLVRAGLLIARLDNPELDVAAYQGQFDRLAREIAAAVPKGADEKAKLAVLNKELFAERGFHGSRADYYNRANSYLNDVLDDREGLPITLSVLYLELARRLGVKVEGVGLPGHFIVRHRPAKGGPVLIDVYEGGKAMSRDEADRKVRALTGGPLREGHLAAVGKKAILVRMLQNLAGVAQRAENLANLIRYESATLVIAPGEVEARLVRAGARFQAGDRPGALADLDWLLTNAPDGVNRDRLLELRRLVDRK